MIKVYDCSNSEERPAHRGKGGPVENDVMRYLKKYASDYGCEFTDNAYRANLLITNDVFPTKFKESWLPKVKRMDGVYFQERFLDRNISLNHAATIADHVIFISEFSRNSYIALYGDATKEHSVALNQVDPSEYFCDQTILGNKAFTLISSATSWEREEKRLADIIAFANMSHEYIQLIGHFPDELYKRFVVPPNVVPLGYSSATSTTKERLNRAAAFLNFSYKDAAPKTVTQGLCCGLPVFYADSGGLPELVEHYGIGIKENAPHKVEEFSPNINLSEMEIAWAKFRCLYPALRDAVQHRDNRSKFRFMLEQYFAVIKKLG